jgi:hypothetical protein
LCEGVRQEQNKRTQNDSEGADSHAFPPDGNSDTVSQPLEPNEK